MATFDVTNVADPTTVVARSIGQSQTDRGTKLMERLVIDQYQNSPNFIAYMKAYIEEMDLLFYAIEEVYYGRMLPHAVGAQLDVIGIILNQSRNINLPTLWFGFDGAPDAAGFADEANPSVGGTFRSEEVQGFTITPLSDKVYRRVLLAKALLLNRATADLSVAYEVCALLIGRVPATFQIVNTGHRQVQLNLSALSVTNADISLIFYMSKYFVPAGVTFTIAAT